MSLAEWQEYLALDRQVRDLERQQRKAAGSAVNWDDYEFIACPTCPPSTSITIRGGWNWHPPVWGGYMNINPTMTFDLSDTGITYPDVVIPNAYWYTPVGIGIYYGDFLDPTNNIELIGDYYGDELGGVYIGPVCGFAGGCLTMYETAGEAEAGLDYCLQDAMAQSQLAICKLILRNNGNTTGYNQWMPIDKVNRGRSYLWGNIKQGYRMG